jgi:hypothetical protein
MKKITSCFVFALVVAGCASTGANLQLESARSIGNVAPDDIRVSNIDRGLTTVKWDAQSASDSYKCSADDMLRRVLCVKK